MGKLTVAQADSLQKKGVLTKSARTKMQNEGLITEKKQTKQYYIKTGPNQFNKPQMYIEGIRGLTVSTEGQTTINTLREEWQSLLKKHCVTSTEVNSQTTK